MILGSDGCGIWEGDGVILGSDGCGIWEGDGCDVWEGDESDAGEGDECDVCYRTLRTGMTLVSTYRSLPTYSSWYGTTIISPYRELSTCNRSRKWFVCLSVCLYNVCMYVCMCM